MITFTTPWPHWNLHANSSPHRMAKARSVKAARAEAHAEALGAGAASLRGHDAYVIKVTFTPPVRPGRGYDLHNLTSQTVKAHIDGIADALNVDDGCCMVRVDHASREGAGHVEFTVIPFMGQVS